jgi:uncharacterized protein (TIGR03435 family)
MDWQDDEFESFLKKFRLREPHREPNFIIQTRQPSRSGLVAAAAVVIAAIALPLLLLQRPVPPPKSDDISATARQPVQDQELFRSAHDGNVVELADGSHVEMRANSEFMLEPGTDGINIKLTSGSIIVTAAKQNGGHLQVRTTDATISVVGTIFLVSVEEFGTRVTVIEGWVLIEEGSALKNLRAGEQAVTNLRVPRVPLSKEISWSRQAAEYIAILPQSIVAAPAHPSTGAQSPPQFGAVSIKPVSPDSRARTSGFSCRGTDGLYRALFGGLDPPIAPQGRCVGDRVRLAQVIAFAYGVPQEYVSGGPDWTRFSRDDVGLFQIQAVAENPSTATLADLRKMLLAMMTDRFKLQIRKVARPVPGYALIVARGGLKLKQTAENEESPRPTVNERGLLTIKGRSTIGQLIPVLTQMNSSREITPVIDKTALTARYDYELVLPPPVPGQRGGMPSGSDLSDFLEAQAGLQLRPEKSISVEMIVIDQVEQPTPN